MSDDDKVYLIRQATLDDKSFIYNAWLKSFRDSFTVRGCPNTAYYANQHALIETILDRPHALAFVACDKKDPTHVFGFVVAEYLGDPLAIHFVYVKYSMRGLGIAKDLLAPLFGDTTRTVVYTHRTKAVDHLYRKLELVGWTYNPYVLYSYLPEVQL